MRQILLDIFHRFHAAVIDFVISLLREPIAEYERCRGCVGGRMFRYGIA
jgi:hypothetical protein